MIHTPTKTPWSHASVAESGGSAWAVEVTDGVFRNVLSDDYRPPALPVVAAKLVRLRIFNDDEGKMNASVLDVAGGMLVVSQFTLHAKTKKGTRPSFIRAAHPDHAIPLYEHFVATCSRELGRDVATGEFGADMQVELTNDGPVTIWMDTQHRE